MRKASQYHGVRGAGHGRWRAGVRDRGRWRRLGIHKTERDAAWAVDRYYGDREDAPAPNITWEAFGMKRPSGNTGKLTRAKKKAAAVARRIADGVDVTVRLDAGGGLELAPATQVRELLEGRAELRVIPRTVWDAYVELVRCEQQLRSAIAEHGQRWTVMCYVEGGPWAK